MTSEPIRAEETEEEALCRELYELHINSGNDSANESRCLERNLWEGKTQIKQQEARIQRLTQSLKEVQRLMKQRPMISPEVTSILNWAEDVLCDEPYAMPRHSFNSATTEALCLKDEADMPSQQALRDRTTMDSQEGFMRKLNYG